MLESWPWNGVGGAQDGGLRADRASSSLFLGGLREGLYFSFWASPLAVEDPIQGGGAHTILWGHIWGCSVYTSPQSPCPGWGHYAFHYRGLV